MQVNIHRRTWLIAGSSLLSLLLIFTAYVKSGPSVFTAHKADAESTHDLLVAYAGKDSDGDGLPDWQEALYGTDPQNAHSVSPTMTDAEAVAQGLVTPRFDSASSTSVSSASLPGVSAAPSTLTDQFARQLFGEYLKLKAQTGRDPSSSEVAAFTEAQMQSLIDSQKVPDTFNQGQVHVSGTGPDALLAYANAAGKVIEKIDAGKSKDEVAYFSDAVYKNDASALVAVKKYSDAYAVATRALMELPVPKELAISHLALANSLMRVSLSLKEMASLETDPILAMLGMASYQGSAQGGRDALRSMGRVYATEHVLPGAGTEGSYLNPYLSIPSTN